MSFMRILYITHHRKAKTFSRCEAWAEVLVRRGHDVTLLCTADTDKLGLRSYVDRGIRWVEAPDLLWGRLRSGWDLYSTLSRSLWIAGREFDLIHCFETRPACIVPLMVSRWSRPAPLVIDWNDWWGRGGLISVNRPRWYQVLFGGMETYFEEEFRHLADATTVTSSALASRAESLGVERSSIFKIINGVEMGAFEGIGRREARVALGLDPDAFLMGYIGRDVNYDLPLVLGAARRVRIRYPRAQLVLAGNKPPGFERWVAAQGAEKFVVHLGLQPYARIPLVVASLDVGLMPFTRCPANLGAWPKKLADYLAAGCPVVANPVGEVGELLSKEPVGLLAGETGEDFADKIVQLIEDPRLRAALGENARAVARRCLAWDRIVDGLEAAYDLARRRFRNPVLLRCSPRGPGAAAHRATGDGMGSAARFNVLGVGVNAADMDSACRSILARASRPGAAYVTCTSVHGVVESRHSRDLMEIHNRSFLTLPDGMPLVWFGQECGFVEMGRVYGPDLMRRILQATCSGTAVRSHFLCGATAEVLQRLSAAISKAYPEARIAGVLSPPFREMSATEFDGLVTQVSAVSPDFIWIGLSTPKQEVLMARLAPRLRRGVLVGVGAAFDILAGMKMDAPRWMQRNGLHWLFRLLQEPRRLGPRYVRIVPTFLAHGLLQLLGIRRYPCDLPPPGIQVRTGGLADGGSK